MLCPVCCGMNEIVGDLRRTRDLALLLCPVIQLLGRNLQPGGTWSARAEKRAWSCQLQTRFGGREGESACGGDVSVASHPEGWRRFLGAADAATCRNQQGGRAGLRKGFKPANSWEILEPRPGIYVKVTKSSWNLHPSNKGGKFSREVAVPDRAG